MTVMVLLFSALFTNAQITGIVKQDGKAVANATVTLHNAKDSSTVKLGVTNNDGKYTFGGIKAGRYLVSASFVGYAKAFGNVFTTTDAPYTVSEIILQKNANSNLGDVTVVAKKPMIEVKADKTILNVENTINAVGQDALELLRKSPGVLVDKDDNLSLAGKNGVQVFIDGKPTPLSGSDLANYLKTLQSSSIEAIELITNPSAKYEAAGNAGIINIRLKKDKSLGTNGSVNAGYGIGTYPKYNAGINLNNRGKKVNLFASYNTNSIKNLSYMKSYRLQLDTVFQGKNNMLFEGQSHNYKAGADYTINKKNTIGIMVNGSNNNFDMMSSNRTSITYNPTKITDRILNAGNNNDMERSNINGNINYRYADTSGRSLNIDADYGRFKSNSNQLQPNYYTNPTTGVELSRIVYNMIAPSEIDIYSTKVDYEQNFKKGRLGFGGKIAFINSDNDFERYNVYTSGKVMDTLRSNAFVYKENINAVYANYNRQYKGFMIQVGLRVENTNTEGNSNGYRWVSSNYATYDTTFKRNYTDFFPSAAITFNKNPMNQWTVNYSRRIDRPAYQDLNPFEFKLDEYAYMKGNTNLTPQYTNTIGVTNILGYKLTTALTFSHVQDVFTQILDTAERSKSFMTKRNLAEQNIVNLSISYPLQIKWYSMFGSVNTYYSMYKADLGPGRKVNLDVFSFNVYMQHSAKISKTLSAELSGFYTAPSIWQGTFKSKALGNVDFGMSKIIMQGKATVKASVSDIFYTQKWGGESNFAGQFSKVNGGWESRQFKLNFVYRFGSNQIKAARQRKTAADEEAQRANSSGGGMGQ